MIDNNFCCFCKINPRTVMHLFCDCNSDVVLKTGLGLNWCLGLGLGQSGLGLGLDLGRP